MIAAVGTGSPLDVPVGLALVVVGFIFAVGWVAAGIHAALRDQPAPREWTAANSIDRRPGRR